MYVVKYVPQHHVISENKHREATLYISDPASLVQSSSHGAPFGHPLGDDLEEMRRKQRDGATIDPVIEPKKGSLTVAHLNRHRLTEASNKACTSGSILIGRADQARSSSVRCIHIHRTRSAKPDSRRFTTPSPPLLVGQ